MSIAENIFVIRSRFKKYFIRSRTLEKQAGILLRPFHVDAPASALVKSLTPPQRIKIELIKASATGARIIILNDLSRFLSALDIASVFETVNMLKRDGIAFLLVDTYLDVLTQYTDRMAVMDSGRMIRTLEKEEYDRKNMEAILFSGREQPAQAGDEDIGSQSLVLDGVDTDELSHISLCLRKGEIISLLDMDDSTNQALLMVLMGETPYRGSILLNGKNYRPRNYKQALKNGVCLISENPTETMLFPHLTALENLYMAMAGRVRFFFSRRIYRKNLKVRYADILTPQIVACNDIRTLNSEELQRLVYAKWLLFHPKVLIVDKPLSVTDPNLGNVTVELISLFAKQGACVLVLSSNPSEAYRLSGTVYPCKDGRIHKSAEAGVLDV